MVDHGVILPFLNAVEEVLDQKFEERAKLKTNFTPAGWFAAATTEIGDLIGFRDQFLLSLKIHIESPQ
jgi:hypothetical protein